MRYVFEELVFKMWDEAVQGVGVGAHLKAPGPTAVAAVATVG